MQPPGNAAREQLRAQLASAYIGPSYSPRCHLLVPSVIGLCGMAAMVALLGTSCVFAGSWPLGGPSLIGAWAAAGDAGGDGSAAGGRGCPP